MIMIKYEGICHLCEEPYADTIDHVVPVARGGSDHPDNLRPAHTSCNSSKGSRSHPKWAEGNPNMWIPGHEPAAIKKQRAKVDAELAKREQALEKQREKVRSALDRAKVYLESESQTARLQDPKHQISNIIRRIGYIQSRVNDQDVDWVDGDSQANSQLWVKYSDWKTIDPREKESNRLFADLFPDIFLLSPKSFWGGNQRYPKDISFDTGIYGMCSRCKKFVTYSRRDYWEHRCSWAPRRSRNIQAEY